MAKKPTYEELEKKIQELEQAEFKRKRAENALTESEEKYRSILENMEEGYFEVDSAGNLSLFNDSLVEILGHSRDAAMGMNSRQYTDEDNAKKLYQTFNTVYTTGKPNKGFSWEIIRKDGSRRYVETSISLRNDFEGRPIGFRGIVRDITEYKHAEELLLDSKKRLNNIIEDIPALICRFDSKGIISFVNKEYCTYFAKNEQELLGTNFLELVPEEKRRSVWEQFLILTPDNPAKTYKHKVIAGNSELNWQRWTNRAIFNKDGKVSVYQSIGYDITEHMRIEKEIREKEKLQGVIELAGTVCHEISQPMQIISGVSDLMLMNISESDHLYKKLNKIKDQIERMTKLTMKLHDITRYETKIYSGRTKIIDLEHSTERRNVNRFMPNKDTIITSKSDSSMKGRLIDINKYGLSFSCNKSKSQKDDLFKLNIHIVEENFNLDNIPCIIISDLESIDDDILSSGKMKRCRVKFEKLTDDQTDRIEYFIQNHTAAQAD